MDLSTTLRRRITDMTLALAAVMVLSGPAASFGSPDPDVVIKVGANNYAAYRLDLTNGAWVYLDADPAVGSPIRATQRALGYREVDYKSAVYPTLSFSPVTPTTNGNVVTYDYSAQAAKTATVGFWASKDLPIIIGPDGKAYITDGHHTTAGYLVPLSPVHEFIPGLSRGVMGHIVANYYDSVIGPQPVTDAWWLARASENNAYLYGTNGNQLTLPGEPNYANLQPVLPSVLPMPTTPSTLTTNGTIAMLTSTYRSLTWGLADGILLTALDSTGKKIAGYKKSAPGSSVDINFVEFYWADFLRNRIVWDDSKTGSPYGSTNGDASVISAPLSFFAAVANGTAIARSEVYRDQYGRRLSDYTNTALFTAITVNWANGSLSNGLAAATDTYHLFLLDDSTFAGDISPSALSTNILHINTAVGMVVTNHLLNFQQLLINDGPQITTSWKDATVSNSTLRIPAGTGLVTLPGNVSVSGNAIISGGGLQVNGTLSAAALTVTRGTLKGYGIINGAVSVQAAGTLSPGASLGTLTINGPLTLAGTTVMEIAKHGATLTSDLVAGIASLTYGGVLTVLANGDMLVAGDTFKLFNATNYARAFAGYNLPPLAAGLAWDTSRLLVDGSITVGPAGATPPLLTVPANQTVNIGTTAVLAGGAVGSEPITCEWWFNGSSLNGPTNNATLVLPNVPEASQGQYVLVAQNAAGSVTSAPVVLTVNQAPIALAQSLTFPWRPTWSIMLAGTDPDGDPLTFAVVTPPKRGTLTGTPPNLVYRPALGANGADSFTFKANDGRLDSAPATVSLNILGWTNQGLVGVGRIAADAFDARGPGLDTLGGIGSGAFFNVSTWMRTGDETNGYTYAGTLYAVPDRGFGDGTQNYLPRIQTLSFAITPYYGAGPVPQDQIVLSNTTTLLLTDHGTNFTGFDANDAAETNFPKSRADSLGQGHRSLDPEGIVRLADGSFFISDEYGPFIYKFDSSGSLQYTLRPPESIMPKLGNYPGTNYFTAANPPTSGRRNNRGLEGLSITPDGKRLFALLQSPTIQDAGAGNSGRNTRVLIFDIDPLSLTFTRPIAEYAYVLTLNGSAQTNKNTPVSEIFALNRQQFLVLERDSGQGFGTGTNLASTYKRVVLASLVGASNILNTPYDLEKGAPGQVSFAAGTLPANVAPVARFDLVDILDPAQLAKFGLNNSTNQDRNTLSEKWESLALVPLNDPLATNDYLLLVMNDNDFKAPIVYHNGVAVGTNDPPVDTMMLAFRVSLPTYDAPVPANVLPSVVLVGPTNATLSAPVDFTLTGNAYDQDGLITKVEFYSDGTKLGEDTTYPFTLPVIHPPLGVFTAYAIAYDNDGASATSAVYRVTIVDSNLPPSVALTSPTNGAAFTTASGFSLAARASDVDGFVKVDFYRGATKIGSAANAPFTLAVTNQPCGVVTYTAVATDNQSVSTTSAPVVITVRDVTPPALTCPADLTVANDPGQCKAVVHYLVIARDACSSAVVACTPASDSIFALGATPVTCLATDQAGNTNGCTFTVTVVDAEPPTLTCPPNLVVSFTDTHGAPVNYPLAAVSDNCRGAAVVCQPTSGSVFPIGTTTVTCRAVDLATNSAKCSFSIRVLGPRGVIEQVLASLQTLRTHTTRKRDAERLDEAIKKLREALEPALWMDETHLTPKRGDKVFDKTKDAAQELSEVLEDKKSTIPDAVLQELLAELVKSCRLLAVVSVNEAEAAGANPKKIAEDRREIAKGDEEAAHGSADEAIQHYRNAWKHAVGQQAKLNRDADGTLHLTFLGIEGETYLIEASDNLTDWVRLGTATMDAEGVVHFIDRDASRYPQRFYRVVAP